MRSDLEYPDLLFIFKTLLDIIFISINLAKYNLFSIITLTMRKQICFVKQLWFCGSIGNFMTIVNAVGSSNFSNSFECHYEHLVLKNLNPNTVTP